MPPTPACGYCGSTEHARRPVREGDRLIDGQVCRRRGACIARCDAARRATKGDALPLAVAVATARELRQLAVDIEEDATLWKARKRSAGDSHVKRVLFGARESEASYQAERLRRRAAELDARPAPPRAPRGAARAALDEEPECD